MLGLLQRMQLTRARSLDTFAKRQETTMAVKIADTDESVWLRDENP